MFCQQHTTASGITPVSRNNLSETDRRRAESQELINEILKKERELADTLDKGIRESWDFVKNNKTNSDAQADTIGKQVNSDAKSEVQAKLTKIGGTAKRHRVNTVKIEPIFANAKNPPKIHSQRMSKIVDNLINSIQESHNNSPSFSINDHDALCFQGPVVPFQSAFNTA